MKSRHILTLALVLSLALILLLLWIGGVGAAEGDPATGDGAPAQVSATAAYSDTISQYGITWYFDQPHEYGRFANGDYWVVEPVTITRITPDVENDQISAGSGICDGVYTGRSNCDAWCDSNAPDGYDGYCSGEWDGTGTCTCARVRHGWQVNPEFSAWGHTEYEYGQGFDTRATNINPTMIPDLPYTAQAGESIVKAVSLGEDEVSPTDCRPTLKTAAVLTVLDTAPPDDGATVFRPPYSGDDKPLYSIHDLRTDLLPSFEPPTGVTVPSLEDMAARFTRVQLDHIGGETGVCIRPKENMPNYGAALGANENEAALRVMLDDPLPDKMQVLIPFVQYGIDLHGMIEHGQYWPNGGGAQPAHELAYVFTAVLLDRQEMKDFIRDNPTFFHDDYSTYAGVDGVPLYGRHDLQGDDLERGYWMCLVQDRGSRTNADPYGYIDGGLLPGGSYQFCCTSMVWKGAVLALHLMPDLKEVWDNRVLIDYAERWVNHGAWTQPDPCAPHDGNWDHYGVTYGPDPDNPGMCILDTDPSDGIGRFPDRHGINRDDGHYGSLFVDAMWDDYRYHYALSLTGTPGDGTIHLAWDLQATPLPTATWRIDYEGPLGDQPRSFTVVSATPAYTLTGLTNYTWYTVTLGTQVEHAGWLTETARVMPTDISVYLPIITRRSE